ncbi:MAG: hypothetical protein A2007_06455 [Verrucomicrobia bacterium GWC2_42_7]|nr:MAG: hypothetical protein A2007_06455 [Verrucomicrobia bacterium GWC2_42_7]
MKRICLLYSFFYLTFICSFLYGLPDFIFVSEIPVYLPFEQHDVSELLSEEIKYFRHKAGISSQAEAEGTPSLNVNYCISESKWRGLFKSYNKERIKKKGTLNFSADMRRLRRLIDLFETESFGENSEESCIKAADNLRIILLANRMKSIFSTKNQSLKVSYWDLGYSNVLLLRGCWEPKWERREKGKAPKPVKIKEVRAYMRHCLQCFLDETISEKERTRWKQKIDSLMAEEANVKNRDRVPYHELREHLRVSEPRCRFVKEFVGVHPEARLYECTHDSDVVGLRMTPDKISDDQSPLCTGLYTYYTHILTKLTVMELPLPDVLTTGYRIVYDSRRYTTETLYALIHSVIEEDRYARAAACGTDFRASYISEPNCLYLVPKNEDHIPYSFLILPNGKKINPGSHKDYDPCESMAIMNQIHKIKNIYSCSHKEARCYFDALHPVWMQAPQRMLLFKTSQTPIKAERFGHYNVGEDLFTVYNKQSILGLSSQISQSPFAYRDYANTLYRQLGLCEGNYSCRNEEGVHQKISNPNKLFASLIPTVFNYYESILLSNGTPPTSGVLRNTYTEGKTEQDPDYGHVVKRLNAILKLPTDEEKLMAINAFLNEAFGQSVGNIVIDIAQAMIKMRSDSYQALFEHADIKPIRMSPKRAIEESPKEKKIQIRLKPRVSSNDTDHADVARILFPQETAPLALKELKSEENHFVPDIRSLKLLLSKSEGSNSDDIIVMENGQIIISNGSDPSTSTNEPAQSAKEIINGLLDRNQEEHYTVKNLLDALEEYDQKNSHQESQ